MVGVRCGSRLRPGLVNGSLKVGHYSGGAGSRYARSGLDFRDRPIALRLSSHQALSPNAVPLKTPFILPGVLLERASFEV